MCILDTDSIIESVNKNSANKNFKAHVGPYRSHRGLDPTYVASEWVKYTTEGPWYSSISEFVNSLEMDLGVSVSVGDAYKNGDKLIVTVYHDPYFTTTCVFESYFVNGNRVFNDVEQGVVDELVKWVAGRSNVNLVVNDDMNYDTWAYAVGFDDGDYPELAEFRVFIINYAVAEYLVVSTSVERTDDHINVALGFSSYYAQVDVSFNLTFNTL